MAPALHPRHQRQEVRDWTPRGHAQELRGWARGNTSLLPCPGHPETSEAQVSWLIGPASPPDCFGGGQLTCLRDLRWDPRVQRLVESPIAEYRSLRRDLLSNISGIRLAPGGGRVVLHAGGGGGDAPVFDAELALSFVEGAAVSLGLRCAAGDEACAGGLNLTLSFSRGGDGSRSAQLSVGGRQSAVPLLPSESSVPLRVLSDRRSIECFVGEGGRGVFSASLLSQAAQVTAAATGRGVYASAEVWAMAPITISSPS